MQVVVDDAAPLRPDGLAIRFSGQAQNFQIATEWLSASLVSEISAPLLDLLEIAAAVFAADSAVRRGGRRRAKLGRSWYRRFDFQIPVRCLDFWREQAVSEQLIDMISFLTEDKVSFEFFPARAPALLQTYFHFGQEPRLTAEHVLLLSGGLDSLAGAVECLSKTSDDIVLVSHRSAPKVATRQKDLVELLRARFGSRVKWLPVEATRAGGGEPKERTQRSRSFLFSVLGFIAARMVGARRVSYFENGIMSINLPIDRQVIGTMATRTTHPLALRKIEKLLRLMPGEGICIESPYAWLTKTEVVQRLEDSSAQDLIRHTLSCTNIYHSSDRHPHLRRVCAVRGSPVRAARERPVPPRSGWRLQDRGGDREAAFG